MRGLVPLLLILVGPPPGPEADFPIDLDAARALFTEARSLSEADGGALWGRKLYGPMLFVDPQTRAVVANHRDRGRTLARVGKDLFAGHLPERVSVGNTAISWQGADWTMVLWPLPGDPGRRGALLMHECFHRIEPALGISQDIVLNHHAATAAGRTWFRLEWRALAEALEETVPVESEALRDAMVFRAYRRSLFPGAAEDERDLELNEGLAEYTGLRLSGADAGDQRRRAIASLRRYDRADASFVRSFAYASGAAYGLLLDAARPAWRRRIRRATDYGRLLRRALRFSLPPDLRAEAERRAALYDLETVRAEESARAERRAARVAADRRRYVEGPVLVVPMLGTFNYAFSPTDVQALDGVGNVYGWFHLNAPFGVLDAGEGALLVRPKRGPRRVIVPAPAGGVPALKPGADAAGRAVSGPGWTLTLARGWKLVPGPRPGDLVVAERPRR